MATFALKNARAFGHNARIRTSGNRALLTVATFALFAVAACSDGVVTPEARKGSTPVPEPTTETTPNTTGTTTTTTTTPTPTPTPAEPAPATSGNPLLGSSFYVNPSSNAKRTADAWRSTRPADATQMDKIATQSVAAWLGNWNTNIQTDANNQAAAMTNAGATPVFVAYNIPQRDCGGLSGGGGASPDAYRTWITGLANGIGSRKAVVILEPDALANMDCLSAADQQSRLDLLKFAVTTLRAKGQIFVYLDAGHSNWKSAATIADRLIRAGIDMANGFSLNVSNFGLTSSNTAYGQSVSALVGGKHFVIDTSRNGLGPTSDWQWCNPAGRAIGNRPTSVTGNALIDAYLWVKVPGESDGACNGYPSSGTWMPEYALGLAQRG
jgi:endoglucanase